VPRPAASFYLWPRTPIDDEAFARRLCAEAGVTVLPGTYLARTVDGANPGAGRVRLSLVADLEDCVAAARRMRTLVVEKHARVGDTRACKCSHRSGRKRVDSDPVRTEIRREVANARLDSA